MSTEEDSAIPFLPGEEKWMSSMVQPIATITWFEGDHNLAAKYLKEKTNEILSANLWLAGKVEYRSKKPFLVHPIHRNDEDNTNQKRYSLDSHFSHDVKSSLLRKSLPLEDIAKHCKPYLVENGIQQGLHWRVAVVPCSESPHKYFAVIHSMSHCIGDGHTYYEIHNMLLCASCEVFGLTATRVIETEQLQRKALGEDEYNFPSSGGFVMGFVFGVVKTALLAPLKLAAPVKQSYLLVDNEKIIQEKQRIMAEEKIPKVPQDINTDTKAVSFVSTNDILTSWFMKQSKCSHGLMAVNFRGRLEGHTKDLAGDYENSIFYYPKDYDHPLLIRKSLIMNPDSSFKRNVTQETTSTPSVWGHITGSTSLVSNWATFSKDSNLPGCQEKLHLPLIEVLSSWPNNINVCVIFRAGVGKTGMYITSNAKVMESLLEDSRFLSQHKLQEQVL